MEEIRVLVTDDEMGMRLGIARVLSDYTVSAPEIEGEIRFVLEQAETGEQALERIAAGGIDLLLLDHKMPGISGLDVLDELSKQGRNLLTVMITAYASMDSAVAAAKRGAYDFLAKPFTPVELRNTVRKAAVRLVLARQLQRLAAEARRSRWLLAEAIAEAWRRHPAATAPLASGPTTEILPTAGPHGETLLARQLHNDRAAVFGRWIEDLHMVAQIEAGARVRRSEPIDVNAAVRFAFEFAAAEAGQRNLGLEFRPTTAEWGLGELAEWELALSTACSQLVAIGRRGSCLRGQVAAVENPSAEKPSMIQIELVVEKAEEVVASCEGNVATALEAANSAASASTDLLTDGLGWSLVRRWSSRCNGTMALQSDANRVRVSLLLPATGGPLASQTDVGRSETERPIV